MSISLSSYPQVSVKVELFKSTRATIQIFKYYAMRQLPNDPNLPNSGEEQVCIKRTLP